jgi:hypothetical protein
MITPSMTYRRHLLAGAWLALVASLVTVPAFAQDPVVLRLDAPVGTTTRYRTETRSWPPGGSVDSTNPNCIVTDVTTESIIALDGEVATVSAVVESMITDLSGTGMGPQMNKVKLGRGRTTIRRIDRRGHPLSIEVTTPGKGFEKGGEVAEHAGGAFTLPEGPVSVGDTWTAPDSIPGGWGNSGRVAVVQITYRLERIEVEGSARVAVVSMNGVFLAWRFPGITRPDASPAASVPGTLSGELRIDIDARRVVSLVTMLDRNWGTDRGFRTRMTKTVALASAAGN